jgi:hypothetical protein
MKIMFLFFVASLMSFTAIAQKTGDVKIVTKVADTSNIYLQVKRALIKNGFIVKDDMNPVVLTTNVSIKKHLGYTIIKAEIKDDLVIIRGFYCNKKFDLKGDVIEPNRYSNIVYFKGSNGWDLLKDIAGDINSNDLLFSK